MTITRLLIVLAATSLAVASAQDQPRQSETFALGTRKFDFSKSKVGQPPTSYSFSLNKSAPQMVTLNSEIAPTCYTMRTYIADRNFDKQFVLKAGPDEVSYNQPAGTGAQTDSALSGTYTTCQPSSQFAVKKAIQTVETVNDGK